MRDDLDRVNGNGRRRSASFALAAKERGEAALWQMPAPAPPGAGLPAAKGATEQGGIRSPSSSGVLSIPANQTSSFSGGISW